VLPGDPIPASWRAAVRRLVPLSRHLSAQERERQLRIAQLFVREVPFEGCQGLVVTDEMKVAIAATAALLVLKQPYPRFPRLQRILLYPDTFIPRTVPSRWSRGVETAPEPTLGQAWGDGMMVLAWADIEADAAHPADGHNVILHEFAHVLDFEDGASDGRPLLAADGDIRAWVSVMEREFDRQAEAVDGGEDPPLDEYAATDPAEFFAVATETYFEDGARLKQRLPAVYEQLKRYYQFDTADWHAA